LFSRLGRLLQKIKEQQKMPELPEVETVRRGLEKLVVGKTIRDVVVLWPKIIETPEVELFQQQLAGQTIEKMERRGKFLIFKLTHSDLISHLRMEGKYEVHDEADEIKKHTHVLLTFTDGSQLRYLDVRKFGRMVLVEKDQGLNYRGILALGPEPTPETFKLADFQAGLKRHHKSIKPLLLDQRLVTGLGNIYVDEALWEAKIHPEQPANTLNEQETAKLYAAIIDVLARAVAAGGTTIRTYLNALGEAGKFQILLNVYSQTGKPCPRCGTPIIKTKVAQRGTHFCPHCQQLKERQ
jgi:formamidopyrimidine-DNA glycosylase